MPRRLVAGALPAIVFATVLGASNLTAQTASSPGPSAAVAPDSAVLQRLLVAEDARGTGRDGLTPLLDAAHDPDTLLRRLAVRGLGRLQRPELGRFLLASLSDPIPAVRAEAANAVAQSLRRTRRADPEPADSASLGTRQAAAALSAALGTEPSAEVIDALGRSLGRLPLPDSAAARAAEAAIRSRFATQRSAGLAHGLYTLARARRATGTLEPATVRLLRGAAVEPGDTVVRRLALLTLAASGGLDSATAVRTMEDRDDEIRRMTLRGAGALSASLRSHLIARALSDSSPIVRTEVAVTVRLGDSLPDCGPLLALTRDRNPYVGIAAIDSMAGGCAGRTAAARALARLAVAPSTLKPADHQWQAGAHALLALARLDPAAARGLLARFATAARSERRAYAARAAAASGRTELLYRLARDQDRNVQEAAILGLAGTVRHQADSVYLRALASSGHQVVLAAADALDSTRHPDALETMLAAFDRLSTTRRENARDPRISLLTRIGALGSAATAPRLEAYVADYDSAVAQLAAATLSRWTGRAVTARPVPLPIRPEPLAGVFLDGSVRLRVTMAPSSGGGSFAVRLFPREAPATVARVLRLARAGWYDGRIFQRVEPNFVVQGGGPDANEYVGDDAFMRDELTMRTHARGTLGISARGRDTGDGQWFLNLVDNPLLDHEYTVFGRIETGQRVAEEILEGDRIGRVEVMRP
ncbi:MAG TPA: peptidylprolyl isomerase [Gemmatimonadales bacterium]|nr:peptidylprolyl isomerase [Gemmatimonadales bacterium]